MNFSDNIGALIYLRNKVQKWKNIALLLTIFFVTLLIKIIFFSNSNVIESDYVAQIKINDIIVEDDHRSKILKEVSENNSIKAVIVRVNSPGGTIVGSEILLQELLNIRKTKPLVILMDSVAASGGYMIALASDYIVAHNGTLTGSIGVLMESHEVTNLADKIGVKFNTYKSSPLKGSPSMFEKSNPNVEKVINESIRDSFEFFSDLVKASRGNKIKPENFKTIFDGRVFTGRQALKYGLIDDIGGIRSVENYLFKRKIDVTKIPVKEIDIEKKDKKLLNRFLGIFPFLNKLEGKNFQNKIMAITP